MTHRKQLFSLAWLIIGKKNFVERLQTQISDTPVGGLARTIAEAQEEEIKVLTAIARSLLP